MDERIRQFVITSQFVHAVCTLTQQQCRKVWETLDKLARDPNRSGLNREALSGSAKGLYSIRVDKGYRIILSGDRPPVLLHVGRHDDAYRFTERVPAQIEKEQLETPKVSLQLYVSPDALESLPPLSSELARAVTMKPEQLRELILRTKKYLPITEFLTGCPSRSVNVEKTFEEIEQILGEALPKSAYMYRAWWANDVSHVQATSWLAVGWETKSVRFDTESVTFIRKHARVL